LGEGRNFKGVPAKEKQPAPKTLDSRERSTETSKRRKGNLREMRKKEERAYRRERSRQITLHLGSREPCANNAKTKKRA